MDPLYLTSFLTSFFLAASATFYVIAIIVAVRLLISSDEPDLKKAQGRFMGWMLSIGTGSLVTGILLFFLHTA